MQETWEKTFVVPFGGKSSAGQGPLSEAFERVV